MTQTELTPSEKSTKFSSMSRENLEKGYEFLEGEFRDLLKTYYRLRQSSLDVEQLNLVADERIKELEDKIFGKSSEKSKRNKSGDQGDGPKKDPLPRIKSLQERYPNVAVRNEELPMSEPPNCGLCGEQTIDSGLRETTQALTVIPKKFEIVETSRVIYGCKCCHGSLTTTPAPQRIMEGSSYSDEMIIDVALSKYLDLVPVGRYVDMAARSGVKGLPPQSLIECTHYLSDFMVSVCDQIKAEIVNSQFLSADETPHRMLEGSDKKSWYLWSFSSETACYFECHDTRSGDVSIEILKYAKCEVLLTDKYSGYERTVREVNILREQRGDPPLQSAFCNAHSRRYFFKIMDTTLEARFYIEQYMEIYRINDQLSGLPVDQVMQGRQEMRSYFEAMKTQAEEDLFQFSEKGKMGKSLKYFLSGYKELTLCLEKPVALDNNRQEGRLRAPVVGRKTWLGTHSERGARTAARLHTIIESCKMNVVNPREYVPAAVQQIKDGKVPMTPAEFKKHKESQVPSKPDQSNENPGSEDL